MKAIHLLLFLFLQINLNAQTIRLIAGGGTGGDGGPASAASVHCPEVLAFDKKGNLFFTEPLNHRIRKINSLGIITTIAGTGAPGFSGDGGLAIVAKMKHPIGIATDVHGNILFSDNENHRIRKIDAATGIITTVAGTGIGGYNGDSIPALTAQLNYPQGLEIDNTGSIYISDNANFRLRKINTSGIISTIAGNGNSVSSGDGGPATAAACGPWNVSFDGAGNIYMSDGASYTIRKINTSGIISTVAGKNGMYVYSGDGVPATNANIAPTYITVDANGVIYIPDGYNDRIRRVNTAGIIETVAGDGTPGYSGDGGPATAAKVNSPCSVILDSCGNLFLSQVDDPRIRKIEFNPGCIPIGVHDVKAKAGILDVFPNPAYIELRITAPEEIKSVSVVDMVGQSFDKLTTDKLTMTIKKNEVLLDIRHLPAGVYMVRVNGVYFQKFLKQ